MAARFKGKEKRVAAKKPAVKKFVAPPAPVRRTPVSFAAARSTSYTPPAPQTQRTTNYTRFGVAPTAPIAPWLNRATGQVVGAVDRATGQVVSAVNRYLPQVPTTSYRGGKGYTGRTVINTKPDISPWINQATRRVVDWTQRHLNPEVGYMQQNMGYNNPSQGNAHPEAWTMRNVGRPKFLTQRPEEKPGPNVPETEGVLSYAPPVETPGEGGGGGGGYDYGGGGGGGYNYPSYSSPFAQYQKNYPMRGVQAPSTPQFRTIGQQTPQVYNQNTTYPARWMNLLTSWRI